MNAVVEHLPRAITEPTIVAGGPIRSLVPTSFEGVWRMAQMLAASPFSPKDMKSPEACAGAITLGLDLGITPIQAVQSIAVINGRPSIWGDLALALVRASPLCEDVEETLTGEGDKMVATCIAKRKGAKPSTGQFTVDDAKRAQLWNKSGPWQQYPKRMLQLRARAFALRDAFPDVLKGISIREEVEDIQVRDASPPPPPPVLDEPTPSAPPQIEDAVIVSETATAAPSPAEAQVAGASETAPPAADAPATDTIAEEDAKAFAESVETAISAATTIETLEAGWAELDVEATLTGAPEWLAHVIAVKNKRLADLEREAQAKAPAEPETVQEAAPPPPPPALSDDADEAAPPPPPQDDPGFDVNGWKDIASKHTLIGYGEMLVAYAKKQRDAKIIKTFFEDSRKKRAELLPLETENEARKKFTGMLNQAIDDITAGRV